MQADFEVGDLVRIRDWDDMVKSFNIKESGAIPVSDYAYFVPEMKKFCGKTYKITYIYQSGLVELDKHPDTDNCWIFTLTMLEHIEDPEPNPLIDF